MTHNNFEPFYGTQKGQKIEERIDWWEKSALSLIPLEYIFSEIYF